MYPWIPDDAEDAAIAQAEALAEEEEAEARHVGTDEEDTLLDASVVRDKGIEAWVDTSWPAAWAEAGRTFAECPLCEGAGGAQSDDGAELRDCSMCQGTGAIEID